MIKSIGTLISRKMSLNGLRFLTLNEPEVLGCVAAWRYDIHMDATHIPTLKQMKEYVSGSSAVRLRCRTKLKLMPTPRQF